VEFWILDFRFWNGRLRGFVIQNPKSKIRNQKWERGFTLVEVVLVAVVLAILLTVSLPGFQRTAQRLRVEHAAFELAQLARLAHERAVAEGRETVWTWDGERSRAWVEAAPGASPPEAEEAGRVESSPLPAGAVVTLTRDGGDVACRCVHFFPEGTAEGATVTVGVGDHLYTVTVDAATGQARLAAGAAAR
jgi:type II secretion system protein H